MELEIFKDLPDMPGDDEEEKVQQPRPVLEDIRTLRKHSIPDYPMFLGRDKKGSICVPVPAVSRKHAKVFERDNVFYVQDLGSINGTYLNDKRILDPVELKDGDRIKLAITKEYPRGAREFTFRVMESKEGKPSEGSERDAILKSAGITGGQSDSRKTLLRNCIFRISKRDIRSMFKTENARRVAINKLDINRKVLSFVCLNPFKVKETLILSIEHPRFSETLRFTIKIVNVSSEDQHNAQKHNAEIIRIPDKHKVIFQNTVMPSPMICYMTSTLKE